MLRGPRHTERPKTCEERPRTAHAIKEDAAPAAANYHFLSGLLIGYEVKEVVAAQKRVTVVGEGRLAECYRRALQGERRGELVRIVDAESALIRGQARIATTRGLF